MNTIHNGVDMRTYNNKYMGGWDSEVYYKHDNIMRNRMDNKDDESQIDDEKGRRYNDDDLADG